MFVVAVFFSLVVVEYFQCRTHVFFIECMLMDSRANKIFICQKFAQSKKVVWRFVVYAFVCLFKFFFTFYFISIFFYKFFLHFSINFFIKFVHLMMYIFFTVNFKYSFNSTEKKCEFTQQEKYKSHVNSVHVNIRFDVIVWITRKIMFLCMIRCKITLNHI